MRYIFTIGLIFCFVFQTVVPGLTYAQVADLPVAGTRVEFTSKFTPMAVKGMKLYPENPFKFDFIVDTGDDRLDPTQIKEQGQKLVSYFLASLTTPEEEMWVNLSPYERGRVIPSGFGETEMGKDLLAQDYLLKQIMATVLYPEEALGQEFWKRVYTEVAQKFGTTDVPVNTFNKVWIVPNEAVVYENAQSHSVFVVKSSLKVMLEQDYLALNQNDQKRAWSPKGISSDISERSAQIMREIIIPHLEREVNEGKNFAPLRQMYQSLILAAWYKQNLKDNVLAKGYIDRNKTLGINVKDKDITQKIYQQYVQSFRKGVYNYIKNEIDPLTHTEVPRKYFSGGVQAFVTKNLTKASPAQTSDFQSHLKDRIIKGALLNLSVLALTLSGVQSIDGHSIAELPASGNTAKIFDYIVRSPIASQVFIPVKADLPPGHIKKIVAEAINTQSEKWAKVNSDGQVVKTMIQGLVVTHTDEDGIMTQVNPNNADKLPLKSGMLQINVRPRASQGLDKSSPDLGVAPVASATEVPPETKNYLERLANLEAAILSANVPQVQQAASLEEINKILERLDLDQLTPYAEALIEIAGNLQAWAQKPKAKWNKNMNDNDKQTFGKVAQLIEEALAVGITPGQRAVHIEEINKLLKPYEVQALPFGLRALLGLVLDEDPSNGLIVADGSFLDVLNKISGVETGGKKPRPGQNRLKMDGKGSRGFWQITPIALEDFYRHHEDLRGQLDLDLVTDNYMVAQWLWDVRIPEILSRKGHKVTPANILAYYNGGMPAVFDHARVLRYGLKFAGWEMKDLLNVEAVLVSSNPAMLNNGGIDLEKVRVQRTGSKIKTTFNSPHVLKRMLNAKGLFPQIQNIAPVSLPMVQMLLEEAP